MKKINKELLPTVESASATIMSSISMAQGIVNVPLTTLTSNTTKLTLSNGGIRIGAGVSKVRLSGGIFIDTPNAGGYNWLRLRKNAQDQVATLISGNLVYKSGNIGFGRIISVVEGDIIYLTNDVSGAGTPYTVRISLSNTWLTVEIVE